jgi:lipopolysaccharide biosynthesis glycosyltransferase
MEKLIHLVFVSDDEFFQHLGVTLTSVLENTKRTKNIIAYVLCADISSGNKNKLNRIQDKYGCNIIYIEVEPSKYEDLVLKGRSSHATYYKLSIPELIPNNVSKVICLDCDMILKSDIEYCWSVNMEDKIIAAVEDPNLFHRNSILGIPEDDYYFNSGLMVMNLARLREENVSQKVFDFVRSNPAKILHHDQDAFNAILHRNWYRLPLSWNVMDYFFDKERISRLMKGRDINEVWKAIRKPNLIHYTGDHKPWHSIDEHPLKREYYKYLSKTGWRNYKPKDENFIHMIKRHIYLIPYRK